jgi:phage shock protein E
MMELLKKLFGAGAKVNYAGLIKQGAVIVDVRTQDEYKSGHIKGAINIPLGNLENNLSKLKKDKCIITCCASGMRSASAKRLLESNGFAEVYNGGGWMGLQNKMN